MPSPVIVVIRHPDYSDDISLHGLEAQVVYIDLGSSFDRTPDDAEQAREWAESTWEELAELEPDHPARAEVAECITIAVEAYFQVVVDGSEMTLREQEAT